MKIDSSFIYPREDYIFRPIYEMAAKLLDIPMDQVFRMYDQWPIRCISPAIESRVCSFEKNDRLGKGVFWPNPDWVGARFEVHIFHPRFPIFTQEEFFGWLKDHSILVMASRTDKEIDEPPYTHYHDEILGAGGGGCRLLREGESPSFLPPKKRAWSHALPEEAVKMGLRAK